MAKTIRKGDVVQFIEGHKWIGCLGIVDEVKDCGDRKRYMVGVPAPMQGTAYIFDDGSGIERIGRAVMVAKEDEDDPEETD